MRIYKCYNSSMFRLWGKIFKNNKLLADHVYENADLNVNRTRKVLVGLQELCNEFNLGVPIWLDSNVNEFKKISKTRFRADSFMEEIDFDYLEIHVIEED